MATVAPLRISLRIVFYRQHGDWIAHCLELDLVGDGRTREAAWRSLGDSIAAQLDYFARNRGAANLFRFAPPRYMEMFASGSDAVVPELRLSEPPGIVVDDIAAREYSGSEDDAGTPTLSRE